MADGATNIDQGNANRTTGAFKTDRPCPLWLIDMARKFSSQRCDMVDMHGLSTAVSCPWINENHQRLDEMESNMLKALKPADVLGL